MTEPQFWMLATMVVLVLLALPVVSSRRNVVRAVNDLRQAQGDIERLKHAIFEIVKKQGLSPDKLEEIKALLFEGQNEDPDT